MLEKHVAENLVLNSFYERLIMKKISIEYNHKNDSKNENLLSNRYLDFLLSLRYLTFIRPGQKLPSYLKGRTYLFRILINKFCYFRVFKVLKSFTKVNNHERF